MTCRAPRITLRSAEAGPATAVKLPLFSSFAAGPPFAVAIVGLCSVLFMLNSCLPGFNLDRNLRFIFVFLRTYLLIYALSLRAGGCH